MTKQSDTDESITDESTTTTATASRRQVIAALGVSGAFAAAGAATTATTSGDGTTVGGGAMSDAASHQRVQWYEDVLSERPAADVEGRYFRVIDPGTPEHGTVYYDDGDTWSKIDLQLGSVGVDEVSTIEFNGSRDLQSAIDDTPEGGTLIIQTESVDFSSVAPLSIDKQMTIKCLGAHAFDNSTTATHLILTDTSVNAIEISADNVTLKDFFLIGPDSTVGNTTGSGIVYTQTVGFPTIEDVWVRDFGGGIAFDLNNGSFNADLRRLRARNCTTAIRFGEGTSSEPTEKVTMENCRYVQNFDITIDINGDMESCDWSNVSTDKANKQGVLQRSGAEIRHSDLGPLWIERSNQDNNDHEQILLDKGGLGTFLHNVYMTGESNATYSLRFENFDYSGIGFIRNRQNDINIASCTGLWIGPTTDGASGSFSPTTDIGSNVREHTYSRHIQPSENVSNPVIEQHATIDINDATRTAAMDYTNRGLAMLVIGNQDTHGAALVMHTNLTSTTVVSDPQGEFSTTKDNQGTVNVYEDGGTLYIENERGVDNTFSWQVFGVGT